VSDLKLQLLIHQQPLFSNNSSAIDLDCDTKEQGIYISSVLSDPVVVISSDMIAIPFGACLANYLSSPNVRSGQSCCMLTGFKVQ